MIFTPLPLTGAFEIALEKRGDDLIALDEALARLSGTDATVAELVKLRYFAGLSIEQAAKALGISRRTAVDHWAYARAWLRREMARNGQSGPG